MEKPPADGPFDWVMPMIKAIVALGIGLAGCFLFGIIGSMTYPGLGAIAGAGIGFVLFTCVGCCALGVYKDFMPDPDTFDVNQAVPGFVQQAMGKHGKFTLIVTVHNAQDLSTFKGLNPFASPDTYVTVECGNNPAKATCVHRSSNPVFNEQFKFLVQVAHKSVVVKVMDQDAFGDDVIGYVTVDIDQEIIGKGFPQEADHPLQTGAKGAGSKGGKSKLVLSFDYTDDFPKGQAKQLRTNFPENYAKKQKRIGESEQQWTTKDYGACQQLKTMQFNTRYEDTIADREAGQAAATAV